MTCYMFYLYLPSTSNLHEMFPENIVNDFYDVSDCITGLPEICKNNDGSIYYLYAVTNNKEYAKIFNALHDKKIFVMHKEKMSSKQYNEFISSDSVKNAVLKEFICDDKRKLIVTENEEYCIEIHFEYDIISIILSSLTTGMVPYNTLKKKYIKALDYLLYCTYYSIAMDDSDLVIGDYEAYGITAEGYAKGVIRTKTKIFDLYFKSFALLLDKGDDD